MPGSLRLPTKFSPSRQHKTTFICCSLACKPPKAAIHCSCIVTCDVIYCARDKCGHTDKQTNRRRKRKAILVPVVCALRLVKKSHRLRSSKATSGSRGTGERGNIRGSPNERITETRYAPWLYDETHQYTTSVLSSRSNLKLMNPTGCWEPACLAIMKLQGGRGAAVGLVRKQETSLTYM